MILCLEQCNTARCPLEYAAKKAVPSMYVNTLVFKSVRSFIQVSDVYNPGMKETAEVCVHYKVLLCHFYNLDTIN